MAEGGEVRKEGSSAAWELQVERLHGGQLEGRESQCSQEGRESSAAGGNGRCGLPNESMVSRTAMLKSAALKSIIDDYAIRIDSLEFSQRYKSLLEPLAEAEEEPTSQPGFETCPEVPPLSVVMLVVGTRGDVQPFVAIGKRLKEYGHRVRLASHATHRSFVMGSGLEFYPLGGDPKVFAEYLVKNKGLFPASPSDVSTQRRQLRSIINSTWPACTEPDLETGGRPFVAEAIIANPVVTGHTHVAEKLQVPLHIFFTMPWTPTRAWPHPFAKVAHVRGWESLLTYGLVETFVDIGVLDILNDFRKTRLGLPPISYLNLLSFHKKAVPTAYMWSPALAPKPRDWGPLIDIVGFCFLNLGDEYDPPSTLVEFLKAGAPPIFFGFGSLPVRNPEAMTAVIVEALRQTGQRGIIQKGDGGLGNLEQPVEDVYIIGNCPHDWLFPQCAAVVHHGGAGTTAAGLKAGRPTAIVPFFGDQFFWGLRCESRRVGPAPISVDQFDLDHVVNAITILLQPEVIEATDMLSRKIKDEDGVEEAIKAFHKHLPKGVRSSSEFKETDAEEAQWTTWCKALHSWPWCRCLLSSPSLKSTRSI